MDDQTGADDKGGAKLTTVAKSRPLESGDKKDDLSSFKLTTSMFYQDLDDSSSEESKVDFADQVKKVSRAAKQQTIEKSFKPKEKLE